MSAYGWIETGDGRSVFRRLDAAPRGERSDLPRPYTQSDGMDDLRHPLTGQLIGSKSQFRRVTKENGGVEVGTDRFVGEKPKMRPVRDDVKRAVEMLKQGYRPKPITKEEFDG